MTARDQWIGWGTNERLRNLGFVVNNGRFLIFPWFKVRYLASHVLGKIAKGLVKDWEQRWDYQPALLETFVDRLLQNANFPNFFVEKVNLILRILHVCLRSN